MKTPKITILDNYLMEVFIEENKEAIELMKNLDPKNMTQQQHEIVKKALPNMLNNPLIKVTYDNS